jgi:hypothetical protein
MKQMKAISGICLIAIGMLFAVGCATSSVPMTACSRSPGEAQKVFDSVWFNGTGGFHYSIFFGFSTAYETTGQLLLFKDSMEFRKSAGVGFEMRDIQQVSLLCLKMTPFDRNKWVAVEYGLPPNNRTIYFADGSAWGWGGATGGTAAMFKAVKARCPEPAVTDSK